MLDLTVHQLIRTRNSREDERISENKYRISLKEGPVILKEEHKTKTGKISYTFLLEPQIPHLESRSMIEIKYHRLAYWDQGFYKEGAGRKYKPTHQDQKL